MVSAMAALRGQTQNSSHSQNSSANKDEPTPIEEGMITEKQKEHSKLYNGRGSVGSNKTLRDRAAKEGAEIQILGTELSNADISSQDFLKNLACKSDVIVVGKVTSKASQFSEDGGFIFTDYEIDVEKFLKNNNTQNIDKSSITITRPGGAVQVNGHISRAADTAFKPLQLGNRYLLFLHSIPNTGAYQTLGGDGSFLLNHNTVVPLTIDSLPKNFSKDIDEDSFVADVRTASNCYK